MPVFMANHRIRFFWLFHRARHADTDMDTTTALRFHPGKLVLSTFIRMPVIILIGMSFAEIVVFETMLNISTLFHHCNLATPEKWDRVLRAVIVRRMCTVSIIRWKCSKRIRTIRACFRSGIVCSGLSEKGKIR